MTTSDILALVNAGFTKQEIIALNQAQAPQTDPEPAPAAVPDPEPAQAEDPVPASETVMTELDPQVVMNELLGIKAAIQGNNVITSRQPEPVPDLTADDILAGILDPYGKEK